MPKVRLVRSVAQVAAAGAGEADAVRRPGR